jgi:tRNA threonylcarbamoyladenosine biosynthesis protein TsaE
VTDESVKGRPPVVEVVVWTAAEMRALGRRLAALLGAGDLVILSGGLGAGKTTLTQGIADGLGVRGPVTSPTFVIARVHPPLGAVGGPAGPGPALVHADAYRLGSSLELDDLDLDADTATSVTVVEWGEGLAEGLAAERLEITIAPVAGGGSPGLDGVHDPGGSESSDDSEAWDGLDGDSPRTVQISGTGERWQDIKLPPADLADRL